MESVMHARFVTVAAVALSLTTSASAEPPKAPAPQPNPAQAHVAPVVFASADHVGTPAQVTDAPAQAKPHRAMRVTTCRCGGDPQPEPQDEQQ
jgi:hypothetical protein